MKPEAQEAKATARKADPQKGAAPAESMPRENAMPLSRASPQLVERVHEFYEELGREDVRAVQDHDKKEKAAH